MRMAKWFFLAAVLWVCAGAALAYEKEVQVLSATMADQISQAGKKSIAVVDFTDLEGNATELGRFLAEEFAVSLASSGKGFEVVDRSNLRTILQEHKLAASGLIDPATAKKLGQIAGVDALVTGTLTPFGDSVRLACKILDTSTARVIGGARGDIPRTKAIDDLLTRELGSASPVPPKEKPQAPAAVGRGATETGPARTESSGYSLVAADCARTRGESGDLLMCSVSVTNQGTVERKLCIGDVQLVDSQANTLKLARMWFGSQTSQGNGLMVCADLPPSLPMKLVLGFDPQSVGPGPVNLVIEMLTGVIYPKPPKAVIRGINVAPAR